eukprot:NODE_6021_length_376_cov_58.688073_g5305_i0.p2 GENE.NODE_6021_length_376_cov_58.688073_g5305_i0~~NODE_6021_length_376_cov_58.688073_g5305_i0.p2  ORF type:complete len:78 (-),score=8.81 NODE_6021_length_376_cov_58.688073_g5305_i0:75-308(-)
MAGCWANWLLGCPANATAQTIKHCEPVWGTTPGKWSPASKMPGWVATKKCKDAKDYFCPPHARDPPGGWVGLYFKQD